MKSTKEVWNKFKCKLCMYINSTFHNSSYVKVLSIKGENTMNTMSNMNFNEERKLFIRRLYYVVTLFILLGFISPLYANNTWSLAGDLKNPRSNHTATTLNSTQVLVTGGDLDSVLLNSAEIFNLNTNSWSLTSSMNHKRQNHVAVLLDDGRVLIAGGSGASADLASAELFDPVTSTWSMAASMSRPRVNALVTKLQNGTILVGGGNSNGTGLTSAEIYDPVTDAWTSTGAMSSDTVHTNAAVLLNDGRVFIKGHAGYINGPFVDINPDDPFYPEESATKLPQIFDPTSNSWSEASPMNTPKLGGTSILLSNGNVLVVGGDVFQEMYWGYPYFHCNSAAETYDPSSDTWTDTGTQVTSSLNPSKVSLLPDGKVLAFGASIYQNLYSACGSDNGQTVIYDPNDGTWSVTDSATTRHTQGAFSSLSDGKVLTIGGGSQPGIVEIYTPSGPSPEPPPRSEILHVGDIDGQSVEHNNFPTFNWSAIATFTILDENGQPVEGANVYSISSSAQTTPDVCITDVLGQCSHEDVSPFDADRTITITNATKSLMTYDATANTDPDGDSDGTTIVIQRGEGPPPPTIHVSDLDGSSEKKGKRNWKASVSIEILNWNDDPENFVEVSGFWSGGVTGTASCTTVTNGICTVISDRTSGSSVTFTVTDAVDSNFVYDSTLNSDPDGDSNGTSITVVKP